MASLSNKRGNVERLITRYKKYVQSLMKFKISSYISFIALINYYHRNEYQSFNFKLIRKL